MRLIDADEFIARFACVPMVQEAIRKAIDSMPTIEPEERTEQPEQENYTELKLELLRTALYIDALLECSDEQKKTLIGFISRLIEFMPWTERG